MTKDASRLSNHALRSLRSLQCPRAAAPRERAEGPAVPRGLRRRESKAFPSSRRMAPRTPCFPERAVGFADRLMPWSFERRFAPFVMTRELRSLEPRQSRHPGLALLVRQEPAFQRAVPGGLKGRAALAPSRTTQAPQRSEERGSKDATRLSSVREIGDFPLAARILRILATSRESFALSNDSESRSGRAPRGLSKCCGLLRSDSVRTTHSIHIRSERRVRFGERRKKRHGNRFMIPPTCLLVRPHAFMRSMSE